LTSIQLAIRGRFHGADWPERAKMVDGFIDDRYRRLGQRLVYFERPDLLKPSTRSAIEKEICRQLSMPSYEEMRWRSIPKALSELETLLDGELDEHARVLFQGLTVFLASRHEAVSVVETV
jgi:hypothetical protein